MPYLDYAALAPLTPEIKEVLHAYERAVYGNPSSLHSAGRNAHRAIQEARASVARTLSCDPREVIFTSGGTEANNLAILGCASAAPTSHRHLIVSAIEHPSVLACARELTESGWRVSYAPVDENGVVLLPALRALISNDTALVSIMAVNNEVGTIQPLKEIYALVQERRGCGTYPLLHTDACQAVSTLPLLTCYAYADLVTVTSAKAGGPRGVGALIRRNYVPCTARLIGGEQEAGLRSGTEHVSGIVAFAVALASAQRAVPKECQRLRRLRNRLSDALTRIDGVYATSSAPAVSPHILHVTIAYIEGESALLMLDALGIAVATGSACASQSIEASHVLRAMHVPPQRLHGSVRFSLGWNTTDDDIDVVQSVVPIIIKMLRQRSALTTYAYAARL